MKAFGSVRLVFALLAAVMLGAPESLSAQMIGGGGKKKGGGRPGGGGTGITVRPPDTSGNYYSYILKYTPEEEADGELAGQLTVKPFRKDLRSLKLRVYRRDDLVVSIGSGSFHVDQFPEVLTKGIHCVASWENEESDAGKRTRHSRKQLLTLTINPVKVEGKIVKIEGDIVTLKAIPVNGADWPEVNESINPNRTPPAHTSNAKKKIRRKKLKLKVLPDIVKMEDATNAPIGLEDLQADMPIEAEVIQGRKLGYLAQIKLVDTEAESKDNGHEDRGGGPRG